MGDYPAQYEVQPLGKPFDATGDNAVRVPGSKSLTNRALLLAALAEGSTTLTGVLFADDTRRMLEALQTLGFSLDVDESATTVTVHGRGGTIPNAGRDVELFLGNAGTATRFLTAACCLAPPQASYRIKGIPRMHQRPIGELVDLLRKLGATIDYLGEDGFPPLRVHGGLREKQAADQLTIGRTLSSQYISALLQIAPCLPRGLEMSFREEVTSRPYVVMTQRVMEKFDVPWRLNLGVDYVRIERRNLSRPTPYAIEPDASNASYFLAAAAVSQGSRAEIAGLCWMSTQGDSEFFSALAQMMSDDEPHPHAGYGGSDSAVLVSSPRSSRLRGSTQDLSDMPDMAQTLAVVAIFAKGETVIRNVGNLRVKETDRLAALDNELTKLGARVTIDGDDITIDPPTDATALPFEPGGVVEIDTYDDHRMAMSFAVAGLASDRLPGRPRVVINDPGCVAKTYPGFWDDLRRYLGARVVAYGVESADAPPTPTASSGREAGG